MYQKSEQPWAKLGTLQVETGGCFVDYVSKHTDGHVIESTASRLTLSATLSLSTGMFAANSDRLKELTRTQNASAFVPVGTTIKAAVPAGAQEMLLFHLSDPPEDLAELDITDSGLEFRNDVVDEHLGALAKEVRRALISGQTEGVNYVEHLIYAFAHRQLSLIRERTAPSHQNTAWISKELIARIHEYVDANLEQPLSLNNVANAVQLPLARVQRALRAETGQSLHQLILHRRVTRARDLLVSTDRTLADISFACGFSSQQHMTNVFSSRLGVSPGRYRRQQGDFGHRRAGRN
ncbi:AraC family transcriptional regulator [Ruegeria sp. SCPT10]|uniref:AraC family transcriptional regulator n=1 Tax=Ruegeria sp. SCP10 TaxID=3141377 RepID=UPI00333719E7